MSSNLRILRGGKVTKTADWQNQKAEDLIDNVTKSL